MTAWPGRIVQIGYLVADLDAAAARRIDASGLGPWILFRNTVLNGHYRGEPTTVIMDVALAYQGDLQIELIQVRSDTPSPYAGLLGLHHVASLVDDLDVAVGEARERGLDPVFVAGNDAVRVAYLETGEPGILHELIEGRDMAAMIADGIAAAASWDGSSTPITIIDFGAAA